MVLSVADDSVTPTDVALLTRIRAMEAKIRTTCDLIPVANWGFNEGIQDRLRQKKHEMVNQHLTFKEKKTMSKSQKHQVARSLGGLCNTVSEVMEWVHRTEKTSAHPTKKTAPTKPDEKNVKAKITPPKKSDGNPKEVTQVKGKAPVQTSSDSDSEDEVVQAPVKKAAIKKPIATVKPLVREKAAEDDECTFVKGAFEDDEGDSSDDESGAEDVTKEPPKKTAASKRKHDDSSSVAPSKKSKLDKDLEKYDKVDPSTLNPIESRNFAMLKLQKKIEDMKINRRASKAKGKAAKGESEEDKKKMRRRLSKMKLKQQKAEEKRARENKPVDVPTEDTPVKPETKGVKSTKKEDDGDDAKVVFSKFDFIVKDKKNKYGVKEKYTNEEKREKFTGRNYKNLLTKVEKREEKIKKARETEPDKAFEMQDDIAWKRALKKSEGIKVKDNVELLKKGIKRNEKLKAKRMEKWDGRVKKVEHDKQQRQDKRSENLQKRVDSKKKKKTQLMRVRGRIL